VESGNLPRVNLALFNFPNTAPSEYNLQKD
jgi:hypothetical protein